MPAEARAQLQPGHDPRGPWVAHWPQPPGAAPATRPAVPGAFVLRTCLRELALTDDPAVAETLAQCAPPEWHSGRAAYQLLLEVTTGLRSAIPGETNVFGQFRHAWATYREAADRAVVSNLAPLVTRLVRDTRAVRHAHLGSLGGASYGSLLRRLLAPAEGERVLIVGAGELARSLLPFFGTGALGVWNRHRPGPAFATATRVFDPHEGPAAASWAHHVVMTTPADAAHETWWRDWLTTSSVRTVVHLGRRRGDGWLPPPRVKAHDLDDLFALRHAQENVRSLQLARARAACRERATAFAAGHAVSRRAAMA